MSTSWACSLGRLDGQGTSSIEHVYKSVSQIPRVSSNQNPLLSYTRNPSFPPCFILTWFLTSPERIRYLVGRNWGQKGKRAPPVLAFWDDPGPLCQVCSVTALLATPVSRPFAPALALPLRGVASTLSLRSRGICPSGKKGISQTRLKRRPDRCVAQVVGHRPAE